MYLRVRCSSGFSAYPPTTSLMKPRASSSSKWFLAFPCLISCAFAAQASSARRVLMRCPWLIHLLRVLPRRRLRWTVLARKQPRQMRAPAGRVRVKEVAVAMMGNFEEIEAPAERVRRVDQLALAGAVATSEGVWLLAANAVRFRASRKKKEHASFASLHIRSLHPHKLAQKRTSERWHGSPPFRANATNRRALLGHPDVLGLSAIPIIIDDVPRRCTVDPEVGLVEIRYLRAPPEPN